MENSDLYIIQDKTIIFNPKYNLSFSSNVLKILSNSNTIIFVNTPSSEYSTFNQPINNLPNTIITLTFGYYFNQIVDILPNSILNLTFGYSFNKFVDSLPNLILNLTFGYFFDKPAELNSGFFYQSTKYQKN